MRIRILGWEYENIRRMNKLRVDLRQKDGSIYPNTLLMMSNGAGKTTTLHLIRAVLSGNAVYWKEREVRSFRPVGSDVTDGYFLLRMEFDGEIYCHILHLDYEEGRAWYETSSAAFNGYEEGRQVPYQLRGIIDDDGFVNRFVFDGEQAKKTLNSGSTEAENAIVYLYQLNKLDELCGEIDRLVREKQEQNSGGTTKRSVKVYKGKMERREQVYKNLVREKDDLQQKLKKMSDVLGQYEKKYQDIVSMDRKLQEEQERLQREKKEKQGEIRRTTAELMAAMKKPYNLQLNLHTRLKGLVENLQTLKLPKTTAREFFNELAASKECICGRCIGEKERKRILEKAEEYLGEDSLVVVNAIKNALREYERDDTCITLKEQLKKQISDSDELEAGLNRLAIRLAEKGYEDALKIQNEMKDLEKKISESKKNLTQLTEKPTINNTALNADNNIHLAYREWQDARDSYLKANGTYQFTKKAEKMTEYVKRVRKNTLDRLKEYMVRETNRKLVALIDSDQIVIRKIDGYLVLDGKDGASEGQTLAVAYAYIGTLFEHSRFEFPFIVDSPAAPMDLSVRREVAEVLPKLFGQTVIFVTSGEKKGFAEIFFKRDDVQYLTIKGRKNEPLELYCGREVFEAYQETGKEEK